MSENQDNVSNASEGAGGKATRRGGGFSWYMLLPMGLLTFTVVTQALLVMSATGDPSHVVEENYYQKAVAWDQKVAQDQANEKLGWHLEVQTRAAKTEGVDVNVSVRGKDGSPLERAQVTVEAFHNARASHRVTKSLTAKGHSHVATLPVRRPGLYEFRFEVARGPDTFTHVVRRDLEPAQGAR